MGCVSIIPRYLSTGSRIAELISKPGSAKSGLVDLDEVPHDFVKANPELSTNINLAIEKGSLKIVIKKGFYFLTNRDSE
jgi:hypothetical protein